MAGYDLFETDYPLSLAEQGKALLISEKFPSKREVKEVQPNKLQDLSKAMLKKNQRTVDLSKEESKHSKESIEEGCGCYTCLNYTKAYLYHMIEVKEMNANILIGM